MGFRGARDAKPRQRELFARIDFVYASHALGLPRLLSGLPVTGILA